MKTDIILAKNWIQTLKEGYGNRFDGFLTFFWKGVGYIIFVFLGARSDFLSKSNFFVQHVLGMGRHEAPWAHIFS